MIMARPMPATRSPTVAEQYELLRAAMLGAALSPNARSGLVVFLHHGMWAWARTIVLDPARRRPTPASEVSLPNLDSPCEQRAVVNLLATMAMTIIDRRPA
jgi:hypothetical protein